jgi:hypothetical protein
VAKGGGNGVACITTAFTVVESVFQGHDGSEPYLYIIGADLILVRAAKGKAGDKSEPDSGAYGS